MDASHHLIVKTSISAITDPSCSNPIELQVLLSFHLGEDPDSLGIHSSSVLGEGRSTSVGFPLMMRFGIIHLHFGSSISLIYAIYIIQLCMAWSLEVAMENSRYKGHLNLLTTKMIERKVAEENISLIIIAALFHLFQLILSIVFLVKLV